MVVPRVKSFMVELAARPVRGLSDEDFARFAAAVDLAPELIAAAPAANRTTGALRVTASVEGRNEEAAFRKAVLSFRRVLTNLSVPAELSEASIEQDTGDNLARHELVTGAEVARRLGLSRERVRQLAADRRRFPPARLALGKAYVWEWGDIIDWADIENRELAPQSAWSTVAERANRKTA